MTESNQQPDDQSFYQTKEMGLDRDLFLFTLPKLAPASITTIDGDEITINESALTIRIRIRPLSPRVLGLITLPRTEVSFSFIPEDPELIRDFIHRFDFHFRRGGG